MNPILCFIPLFMLINVNSYEDCKYVSKSYTLKNYDFDYSSATASDWKYSDVTYDTNFTFIAENVDDCKNRALREYKYSGYYFDNKVDNSEETFLKHCCFLSYDNMEKHEDPNIYEEEMEKVTINSITDLHKLSNRKTSVTKKEEITGKCIALTENQYKHIKEYIIEKENDEGYYINLKIDCNTSYLQFFMITLMLLFLL